MPTNTILSTARQFLEVDPTVQIIMEPIRRGASGRTIVRLKTPDREPFIGIHWTDERADNAKFVPVARFLAKARLRVPEILFENQQRSVVLVEDLGNDDLLGMKDASFEARRPFYKSAFEQVDRLFYVRPPKDLELMPMFDAGMYRWEQEYFFDHFIESHLGLPGQEMRADPAFTALAERLGTAARHLVHRDFQSQNLMIRDGKTWMIDFQGLRRGRQEYDLASLVYDPYLDHSAEEREQLLDIWEEISDERPEPRLFAECASQRMMQALGAYACIIAQRGDEWYRPHIATALKFLLELTAGTPLERALAPLAETAVRTGN